MQRLKFVDLFAGCGGLSLGMSQAGFQGIFAIERDQMAFETFKANLLCGKRAGISYSWPSWLAKEAWDIEDFLGRHRNDIAMLSGTVDVLCGGPPCQGFSLAGRRQENDPRNQLFNKYVEVVEALEPRAIVLENVPGMKSLHGTRTGKRVVGGGSKNVGQSYYDRLVGRLSDIGYKVTSKVVDSSRFGVPQRRPRLIAIGLRRGLANGSQDFRSKAFELLDACRVEMLNELGLEDQVTARDAISDLETEGRELKACADPESKAGFQEVDYDFPRTKYQMLMQGDYDGPMDSMRIARHRPEVRERFQRIISECRKGVPMDEAARRAFGLKKQRIHPMSPLEPSPTVTTLPDDILHYAEPRILTVRESARLQSFPDWFHFKGNYTTGGHRRRIECPRYTQVGNAVPPLLARAIGLTMQKLLEESIQCTSLDEKRDTKSKVMAGA